MTNTSEPSFNQSLNNYIIIMEKDFTSRFVFALIAILLICVIAMVVYSIIWYEKYGANNRHTIINQVLSAICWNILLFFLAAQMITVVRYIYGPLHSSLCSFALFTKRYTLTSALVFLNAISIVRYIFIFWLKNVLVFHDDFWFRFLVLWTQFFSLLFQLVFMLLPGKKPFGFNFCTGMASVNSSEVPLTFYYGIEIPTVLLQIAIFARIKFYNITLAGSITDIDKKSIINSTINFTFVSLIFILYGFSLIGNLLPVEKIIIFPYYLLFHFTVLIVPCIVILIFVVFLYVKNPDMKTCVKRELNDLFLKIIENM